MIRVVASLEVNSDCFVAAAIAATTIFGCNSEAEDVCRKDAERWGTCIGELTESKEFGDSVKRELEAKISRCVSDKAEVAIARACIRAPTCDAWSECWLHRGKPPR